MNRTIFSLLLLSFTLFTACSDDEDYNPDTAISYYEPIDAPKVAGIKMKMNDDRNHTWDYKFQYDAKDRIKEIDLQINTHTKRNNRSYKLNIHSKAQYKFVNEQILSVSYTINENYPEYPAWNDIDTWSYNGVFTAEGYLKRFGPFDCEYNGGRLQKSFMDNGREYTLYYDVYDNVTGYVCDSIGKHIDERNSYEYEYGTDYKNRTNFDFSAFIGNVVVEREIAGNELWCYSPFHLGTFGMLGVTGLQLPRAQWEMSGGVPVKCKYYDSQLKLYFDMEISYVE